MRKPQAASRLTYRHRWSLARLGGRPECSECGCIAGAGLASIGKFKLAGLVKVSDIFRVSKRVGKHFSGGQPDPARESHTALQTARTAPVTLPGG